MALNDIKVPKENAQGTFDETVLTAADISAAPTSRTISAGTGLSGGGDLSANRTLSVSFGSSAGTACEGNDARLSDARTPSSTLAHAANHATGGSDPLAPSDIGAQSLFASGFITSASSPSAARAIIYDVMNTGSAYDINLPTTNSLQGDVFVFRTVNSMAANVTIKHQVSPFPAQTVATLTAVDQQLRFIYRANAQQWDLVPVDTHTHPATDITSGALTHERGGLEADVSAYSGLVKISGGSTSAVTVTAAGEALLDDATNADQRTTLGLGTAAVANLGTGATDAAYGNHTHSQLHDRSHAITSTSDHTAGNHKVFYSNGSGEIVELALGSNGTVLTSNGATSAPSFAAASGGVGGSTGSTDNAILRADGTGGATAQDSPFVVPDNATASPNNTVNHASIQATGGTTNVSVSIVPKGTGAFMLRVPDAASTGGNARGANAVDLQTSRSAAGQVASGQESVVCGGVNNTASGAQAVVGGGLGNTASGQQSIVFGGRNNTASNDRAVAAGDACTASAPQAVSLGWANSSSALSACALGETTIASAAGAMAICIDGVANRRAMLAQAAGRFAAQGDAQRIHAVLRNKTTNATATELFLDGSSARLTIPSGKVMAGIMNCVGVKSDGSAVAHYVRQFCCKNVAGTSSLVGTVTTIGTDQEDNASTDISVTISDANDAVTISVTGIASETWRWVASVDAVEVAYGS